MARLIVSSDWHADWFTDGYSRHEDLRAVVEQLLAVPKKGDLFVMLGDLANPYSRDVHRAMSLATYAANRCNAAGVMNVWITGNHDIVEDDAGSHSLQAVKGLVDDSAWSEKQTEPMKVLEYVQRKATPHSLTFVADEPLVLLLPQATLLCLPYTSPARAYDPDEWIRKVESRPLSNQLHVLGHLNIEGIGPGSETSDMARGRDVMFPLEALSECLPKASLWNGHYHKQQVFKGVTIPGSLARLTHSEENEEKGFIVRELT